MVGSLERATAPKAVAIHQLFLRPREECFKLSLFPYAQNTPYDHVDWVVNGKVNAVKNQGQVTSSLVLAFH